MKDDTIDIDISDMVDKKDIVNHSNDLKILYMSDNINNNGDIDDNDNINKIENKKYNVFNKATVFWVVYFLIGVGFTMYRYLNPVDFVLDLTQGIAWKVVLTFLGICALKYIWLMSIICIIFTFKRKEYPKYFSFIFGFYTLLLIFSVVGVVI